MPRIPAITLTETNLHIVSFNQLMANPEAWDALKTWCTDHGINDHDVVPSEPIFRLRNSIEFTTYARHGHHGPYVRRGGDLVKERVLHDPGRTPAPWPAALVDLAEKTHA